MPLFRGYELYIFLLRIGWWPGVGEAAFDYGIATDIFGGATGGWVTLHKTNIAPENGWLEY